MLGNFSVVFGNCSAACCLVVFGGCSVVLEQTACYEKQFLDKVPEPLNAHGFMM